MNWDLRYFPVCMPPLACICIQWKISSAFDAHARMTRVRNSRQEFAVKAKNIAQRERSKERRHV